MGEGAHLFIREARCNLHAIFRRAPKKARRMAQRSPKSTTPTPGANELPFDNDAKTAEGHLSCVDARGGRAVAT